MVRTLHRTSTLPHNQTAETRISGFGFLHWSPGGKRAGSVDEVHAAGLGRHAVFNEECGLISAKDYSTEF